MSDSKEISELFRDFEKARELNLENLKKILRDNKDTEYGRGLCFADISSEEDYCRQVPVTRYEDYNGLCAHNRYTVYPIRYTLATSGSTGRRKVFPLTGEALDRYGDYIYSMPYRFFGGKSGSHIHTSVFRLRENEDNLLSSAYFGELKDRGYFDPSAYVGGEELLFSEDITDVFYVKSWLMLCCPDLVSIQSIFLYDVLLIMSYIEENRRSLLKDMKEKRVSADLKQDIKKRLLACLPEPSVLECAEKVLSGGFDTPILPRLFGGMRFISGIGGKSMEFQTNALKRYSGTIPLHFFAYASSECMTGIAICPEKDEYALLPYSAYYEFLDKNEKCVQMDKLLPGECYEIVLTTFGGLYRYRTGDIIRIVRFVGETPMFKILGRKQTINIAGEKLNAELVEDTLVSWAERFRVNFSDFAVGAEHTVPGRYWLFIETAGELPRGAGAAVDKMLIEASGDYMEIRKLGMLEELKVKRCGSGSIAKVFGEGHSKHRTFLKEWQTKALLNANDE